MCVWLRMHAYMSTRAQIRVYGEGFSMTHWLTSPEVFIDEEILSMKREE